MRRADRIEIYFQRASLLALVVLYIVGFSLIDSQANRIDTNQKEANDGRTRVVTLVCDVDNSQNAALRALIINGAKASKPFDELYRQYGQPSYEERVKAAKKAASTLGPINCKELISSAAVNGDENKQTKGR
jgi:hypothetical protein